MPFSPRVLVIVIALAGCGRSAKDASVAPEPAPAPASEPAQAPSESQTFVSTANNEAPPRERGSADPAATAQASAFAVVTPEAAKELADAAVSDQLDPKKTWKLSPVLPAAWPADEPVVVVFFYPMSANPGSLTRYKLYSPAFRVTVSLTDGATEVKALGKRRELGTIEETRPSSLERRELELAETSLVERLIGADTRPGENPYWGYLKYVHEHPKVGNDLERRAPAFFGWVRKKVGK
jgi:hypothetical protein